MNRLKQVGRLMLLAVMISLATIGVGLSGGIPVNTNRKQQSQQETRIELVNDRKVQKDQKTQKEIK